MFAHPLMLAWAAAAAVPLVLRLAGRAAEPTVDFSAMLFLPGGSAAAASAGGRWRDWALLLLRSAALGLLAVALARPVLPAAWAGVPTAGLAGDDRATVAVVLDDAAGTGYRRGGSTRFDDVSRLGLGVLAGLGRGDRACVVPDPPPAGWQDARPSADLSAAAAAVGTLRPTRRPADLADALARAAGLLADAAGPRVVVVVCDREASAWRGVTDPFARAWRAARDGRPPPRVVVVPVGGDEADNVAVESVRAVDGPLVRDVPGVVRVVVRNWGPDPRADLPLAVWTGPRPLADTTVSLPAHGVATVDVRVQLMQDGERLLSAAVQTGTADTPAGPGRGLAFDDRRDSVVDVVPPARVLLVTDDRAAAFPLRAALAPASAAGRRGGDPAAVTVVTGAAWTAADPSRYDVVVLADAADVSPDRAEQLRRFVDDGGGLLVAPGGHVSAADYNQSLGFEGVSLLPAPLADPPPAAPVGLRPPDPSHPAFAFAARPHATAGVRLDRLFGLGEDGGGTTLATTADGRPWAVATDAADAGRVLLLAGPLDDTWGNLPRTPAFVPLVQSAVRWLAGGGAGGHDLAMGRPIVLGVDGAVDPATATVTVPPGDRREAVRVTRRGGRSELRYDRTQAAGTYRLRYRLGGRERTAYFVVPAPAEASDLTPVAAAAWPTLARRVGFVTADPTPAAVLAAVAKGRGGPEAWVWGLGGVGLLLVAESLLGRRWSGAYTPGESPRVPA